MEVIGFLLVAGHVTEFVRGLRAAVFWRGVYTNAAIAVVPPLSNWLFMDGVAASVFWRAVYSNAATSVVPPLWNRLLMNGIGNILFCESYYACDDCWNFCEMFRP